MSRNSPPLLLGLLALLLVASPAAAANRCAGGGAAQPDDSGVGGTGIQAAAPRSDDSGVGGTGARPQSPDDDDSGVGGTGVSAENDTGVIGTITGFASICVGDVEIAYDAASAVTVDGQRGTSADLGVGQVVEVVASGSGDALSAREIAVRHVVAGPVTRTGSDGDELEVIGQKVRLTATTRSGGAEGQAPVMSELTPGTFVRVSGLRQTDGTIVASRLTRGDGAAVLSGTVEDVGADHVTVAGTTVRLATLPEWSPGDEVRVAGSWSGDHLVATSMERVPRVPFDGRVGRVEVEGYPHLTAGGELRVGAYRFDLSRDVSQVPDVNDRAPIRIDANVRDGRAIIDRIGAAPELPPRPSGPPGRPPGPDAGAGRPDRPDGAPPRPDGRMDVPNRPDRPDAARPPDRPPHLDRPPPPARPDIPTRPDRPPRPFRP